MSDAPTPESGAAWVRASLSIAVLATLAEAPAHGYALAQRIVERGLSPVRGGALYPVLGRLETEGAVTSSWQAGEGGPGKKVYALTGAGHVRLRTERAAWHEFSAALDRLLSSTPQEHT